MGDTISIPACKESWKNGDILFADGVLDGDLSRSSLAVALGNERVSGAINRAVKELLAKGLIEYSIPEKPNSRLQKYRIVQVDK